MYIILYITHNYMYNIQYIKLIKMYNHIYMIIYFICINFTCIFYILRL